VGTEEGGGRAGLGGGAIGVLSIQGPWVGQITTSTVTDLLGVVGAVGSFI